MIRDIESNIDPVRVMFAMARSRRLISEVEFQAATTVYSRWWTSAGFGRAPGA